VDLTITPTDIASKISGWRMEEKKNLCDHNNITFELKDDQAMASSNQSNKDRIKLDYKLLDDTLRSNPYWVIESGSPEELARNLSAEIIATCGKMVAPPQNKRRSVHWWSSEIKTLRGNAIRSRRILKRKRLRSGPNECQKQLEDLRRHRRERSRVIKIAKEAVWKKLCDQVEREPWGMT